MVNSYSTGSPVEVDDSEGNSAVNPSNGSTSSQALVGAGEVLLGTVAEIATSGQPIVEYGVELRHEAVTTVAINRNHIGRQVALLFSAGDRGQPVIMGLIHNPLAEMIEAYKEPAAHHQDIDVFDVQPLSSQNLPKRFSGSSQTLKIDGERVEIEGKEEVVLRCGDASITLTKTGKILLRGKYVLSRSSGVNRILGASVQVN